MSVYVVAITLLLILFATAVAAVIVALLMFVTDTRPYEIRNWLDRTRLDRRLRKMEELSERAKAEPRLRPSDHERVAAALENAEAARREWKPRPKPTRSSW